MVEISSKDAQLEANADYESKVKNEAVGPRNRNTPELSEREKIHRNTQENLALLFNSDFN